MPGESIYNIPTELCFSSHEIKQSLLDLRPSKIILNVTSVAEDGSRLRLESNAVCFLRDSEDRSGDLLNATTSPLTSKVSSHGDSTQPEAQKKSSNIASGETLDVPPTPDQGGVPDDKNALVTQFSSRDKVEHTKKKIHTVFCLLHCSEVGEMKCNLCQTPKECQYNYDEEFASGFKQFLNGHLSVVHEPSDDYMWYIEDHLKKKKCPSFCAQLWSFCVTNNLCNLYKYADEGVLLYSKIKRSMIGSICNDYADLENYKEIGKGGFGKVYLYASPSDLQLAIKKEKQHPLLDGDAKLFKQILELDHPNVIKTLECLVDGSGKRHYLLVMPFMNRKGLDEQFKQEVGCNSVLDYMAKYKDQKIFIFRNFLELFHQIFEGLDHFKKQRLVHRDIKPSNILVHQKCLCKNTLLCTCSWPAINKPLYVLGDMNLLCVDGESSFTSEMWQRIQDKPAGTRKMQPPECFYRTGEGNPVISHKSDVWSGCVTMIHTLVGREVNKVPDTLIGKFLKTATKTVGNDCNDIDNCCNTLESIIKKYEVSTNPAITASIKPLLGSLKGECKKLRESGKNLQKVQAFQGGAQNTESPLAGIFSTVYVANSLHWTCLTALPHVYDTPLWNCMCDTIEIISEEVRFIPENRKDAAEIVKLLKPIKAENDF